MIKCSVNLKNLKLNYITKITVILFQSHSSMRRDRHPSNYRSFQRNFIATFPTIALQKKSVYFHKESI